MQKLRLPFKESTMLCGYKTQRYLNAWGYPHYGIDISTYQGKKVPDHTIYASGVGTVVAAGWDSKLGGALCIRYDDVYDRRTGKTISVISRYMHMEKVLVKQGDTVRLDTPIGIEGKEGTSNYHLHLEFDTDLNYPKWTPQVSKGLSFWVKGTDSTVNPSCLLYQDKSHTILPDNWEDGWLNQEDKNIPFVDESTIKWDELRGILESAGIKTIEM